MIALKIVYIANIIVAGWISVTSILSPKTAATTIAVLSILGLWRPISFSPILLVQLIYKGTWLLVVALPAIKNNENYPSGMALFLIIWVLVLPFIIPWSEWTK
jgi:hypothetical protein